MTLEINYTKKTGKFRNMWELNNALLNNQWVKGKIKQYHANENGNVTKSMLYMMKPMSYCYSECNWTRIHDVKSLAHLKKWVGMGGIHLRNSYVT